MPERGGSNRRRASMVWRWLAFVCVASALCWLPSANAQQARRIFLFEGLAPWQPGGAASLDAFRQRLTEKSPVNHEVYLDYLDLGRFPGKAHEERLVRFLGEKFAQNPPHLLVPNGPGSLSLLVRHRDAIAPGVPIVYCCASRRGCRRAQSSARRPRRHPGIQLGRDAGARRAIAARRAQSGADFGRVGARQDMARARSQ